MPLSWKAEYYLQLFEENERIEVAYQLGYWEGYWIGYWEGRRAERADIALRMRKLGMTDEQICAATTLSPEELSSLDSQELQKE